MNRYVIYVKHGGYVGKGSFCVQGEIFKVLTQKIDENTRIFNSKESAEKTLDKLKYRYSNTHDAVVVEINQN